MNLANEVQELQLTELQYVDEDVLIGIRDIRNEVGVRKNMYTDHVIAEDEHFRWVASLTGNTSQKFFAVFKKGRLIGGVSLNAINSTHKRADWAYYLSASEQGKGTGSALEFRLLDYAFGEAGIHKLNCEVISWNAAVVKIHKRFGFVEEDVRRDHVFRDSQFHDVVLLGITRDEWSVAREKLTERLFAGA